MTSPSGDFSLDDSLEVDDSELACGSACLYRTSASLWVAAVSLSTAELIFSVPPSLMA